MWDLLIEVIIHQCGKGQSQITVCFLVIEHARGLDRLGVQEEKNKHTYEHMLRVQSQAPTGLMHLMSAQGCCKCAVRGTSNKLLHLYIFRCYKAEVLDCYSYCGPWKIICTFVHSPILQLVMIHALRMPVVRQLVHYLPSLAAASCSFRQGSSSTLPGDLKELT